MGRRLTAEILAATGAGCATTIVGHPLDTIKVHLQTNNNNINNNNNSNKPQTTWTAARSLWRQNALFRGITPPLLNAVVMNTVMFSVFYEMKQYLVSQNGKENNDNGNNNNNNNSNNNLLGPALIAGLFSGFATACISTPTDYVKIQEQLYGGNSNNNINNTAAAGSNISNTLKSLTVPILFRGHVANLCREGVFTMTYLGLYDHLHPEGFWQVAAASSATGGLAWIVSYPFDTIKSIIQSRGHHSSSQSNNQSNNNMRSVARELYYNKTGSGGGSGGGGGISAFYRGCGASTGRAVMVTSLRMIVYEYAMKTFSSDPSSSA